MTRDPIQAAADSVLDFYLPGDHDGTETEALTIRAAIEIAMWRNIDNGHDAADVIEHYIETGDHALAWVAAVCLRAAVDLHELEAQAAIDELEWSDFLRDHAAGVV